MATYSPPDLFSIHFWASARYSSASLARLASWYFWKKASEPTEREPGELRAPTQTAARAGRAVTLLARAVKNGVHSPLWWLFPPRTLGISGKKRASQQREDHGQLRAPKQTAALAVLQALAVLHAGRPAPWPCCTANVRGSQTMRTMRTDLPGGLCTGQLSLGLSWTDVVRWFIGATCGVHACLGDSFPAVLPAPFAQTLRRHLSCTDKRQ